MIFDDHHIQADAKAHALDAYPEEACGIVSGGEYVRCPNIAESPTETFRLDCTPYIGRIEAVIHSHPQGQRGPSFDDMTQQQAMAVPWGIVAIDGRYPRDIAWWGDTVPIAPLVGRDFVYGVWDCGSLVRDWYRSEMGMWWPDIPREDGWWLKGENLYIDTFAPQSGFIEIPMEDLRRGDVLMGKWARSVEHPHHTAVCLGDGTILHHLANRLSRREPLQRWIKYMTHAFRHRDLL